MQIKNRATYMQSPCNKPQQQACFLFCYKSVKIMCECDGISNDKIQVYKVIDDETTPNGIVYKNIDDTVSHIQCWVENLSPGEDFDIKVISEEMTESQFENLPEFD